MANGWCDYCAKPLLPSKREDARFCDDWCRSAARRFRRTGKRRVRATASAPRPGYEVVTVPPASAEDLAYLAGIIDGEGHFATPKHAGHGIVVCMADVAILEWCHERFSGSLSGAYVPPGNSRPRKIWQVSRHADLAHLLPLLTPRLVLKRRECELMIRLNRLHIERPTRALTPDFIAARDELREAIRASIRERKLPV